MMTFRVRVNAHKQVILVFFCLNYHIKITRFKVRVEFKVAVVTDVDPWIHAYELAWDIRLRELYMS